MTILPLNETEIAGLNPGIRSTVQTLRRWEFNTTDSGDGSTAQYDCDLPHPYVHIITDPAKLASETDRLVNLLNDVGVNFDNCPHPQDDPEGAMKHPSVEACYLPLQGGTAAISLMNVILPHNAEAMRGGTDSQPNQKASSPSRVPTCCASLSNNSACCVNSAKNAQQNNFPAPNHRTATLRVALDEVSPSNVGGFGAGSFLHNDQAEASGA